MDTKSTAAEGRFELEETYLPAAANLLRDDHGVPQTINLKLDVAAHVLKRRHQGRETYSPTGENSI